MKAGNFALAALAAALVAAHPFLRTLLHHLRVQSSSADNKFQPITTSATVFSVKIETRNATLFTPPTLSRTPFGSQFLPMDSKPLAPTQINL
jgi:hypothetical protein